MKMAAELCRNSYDLTDARRKRRGRLEMPHQFLHEEDNGEHSPPAPERAPSEPNSYGSVVRSKFTEVFSPTESLIQHERSVPNPAELDGALRALPELNTKETGPNMEAQFSVPPNTSESGKGKSVV